MINISNQPRITIMRKIRIFKEKLLDLKTVNDVKSNTHDKDNIELEDLTKSGILLL